MQQLVTVPTIADGLGRLGVGRGAKLLIHCSLSRFGRVQGGAQAVIEALTQTVGETGTLVMPTLTNGRFDPSEWRNPPMPEQYWDRVRFETPAFHPRKTPTDHTMSAVYELFRTWPGVARSHHPHSSMAAWGSERDRLMQTHKLEERFGNSSPLGRLYKMNAQVLFLGTTYDTNPCFHLAEYRQPNPPKRQFLIVQGEGANRALIRYEDVDTDSSIFGRIGADFELACPVRIGTIGEATCRLFSLRTAVDYAQQWFAERER